MHYSIEPRDVKRIYVNRYGFLPFAKIMVHMQLKLLKT